MLSATFLPFAVVHIALLAWGLPVANFGEIVFTVGVMATILHFSRGVPSAPR